MEKSVCREKTHYKRNEHTDGYIYEKHWRQATRDARTKRDAIGSQMQRQMQRQMQ